MSDITVILDAMGTGRAGASEELLPLVYDELRRQASRLLSREAPGQTLQATALVHEAWLRLGRGTERSWSNRVHFFRAAAQAMRRILVERARRKGSLKHGGDRERLNIDDVDVKVASLSDRLLMIDEALTRLEIEDPDTAWITILKFYGGFTNREIAGIQGVTERTVERHWAYAKTRLYKLVIECES